MRKPRPTTCGCDRPLRGPEAAGEVVVPDDVVGVSDREGKPP